MLKVPEIGFQESRLENGLQLLLHPDLRVPLLHLSLHYRVGSSDEEPGYSGFAHLFEHMMFQGSENVPKNEHGKYVDNAGGRWNATTGKDRTHYYETLPSHHLELALWLEADRMRSLKVTPENFENQRSTVIEEKKQVYDNRPYGMANLRFEQLAYQNWRYAHPIIGSVEDLEKSTLEDAVRFHHAHYRPGNATLVLAGDLDTNTALERVNHYFGDIPNGAVPAQPDLKEPIQTEEKIEHLEDPLAVLPAVYLGYHMAALGTPEYYAMAVLSILLSHGESSRFYRRFIFENNWITSLSIGPNQYRGPELFYVWFQVQNEVPVEKVLDEVYQELDKVASEPISTSELEKIRNQIAHRFVGRLSKISRIGDLLGHYAVFYGDAKAINHDLDRYMAVTAEDLQTAAQTVFRPTNRTLMIVTPGEGGTPPAKAAE